MENLKRLISLCESTVSIEVNAHKGVYESIENFVEGYERDEIEDDIYSEMIARDSLVKVQFFLNSPNTSYVVWHYDIEDAIREALEFAKQWAKAKNEILNTNAEPL